MRWITAEELRQPAHREGTPTRTLYVHTLTQPTSHCRQTVYEHPSISCAGAGLSCLSWAQLLRLQEECVRKVGEGVVPRCLSHAHLLEALQNRHHAWPPDRPTANHWGLSSSTHTYKSSRHSVEKNTLHGRLDMRQTDTGRQADRHRQAGRQSQASALCIRHCTVHSAHTPLRPFGCLSRHSFMSAARRLWYSADVTRCRVARWDALMMATQPSPSCLSSHSSRGLSTSRSLTSTKSPLTHARMS